MATPLRDKDMIFLLKGKILVFHQYLYNKTNLSIQHLHEVIENTEKKNIYCSLNYNVRESQWGSSFDAYRSTLSNFEGKTLELLTVDGRYKVGI